MTSAQQMHDLRAAHTMGKDGTEGEEIGQVRLLRALAFEI
jgi:hypothetical protein